MSVNDRASNQGGTAPLVNVDATAFLHQNPQLKRCIDSRFDLGDLCGRITLMQQDDLHVVMVLLQDYVRSDEADELERLIVADGLTLAQPSRKVVSSPLLLALRERMTDGTTKRSRDGSALEDAFNEIIVWAFENEASDVHFNVDRRQPSSQVWFTIQGRYLQPDRFRAIASNTLLDMLAVAWMRVRGGNGAVFDPALEQQGRILTAVARRPVMLRWASLAADAGPSVCLRLLRLDVSSSVRSLSALGYLPTQVEALRRARERQGGAIVLAGTVGAGKSTTLATLLAEITASRKLVTLEDPVEYLIPGALQNTLTRSLQADDDAVFDAKLRTLKRSALDDLLIGEVRDVQTGRAFMDLALSGTRVYATTHTHSAMLIPERLASDFIGVSRDLLSSPGVLKLLVHQSLFPALCGYCAHSWVAQAHAVGPMRSAVNDLLVRYGISGARARCRNPQGCDRCRTPQLDALWGYDGRTAVVESIAPDEDDVVLACIRQRDNMRLLRHLNTHDRAALDDADMTHKTAQQCGLYKVSAGLIDPVDLVARFGFAF